jgi:NADH-quinone oxidoreductase subunit G
MSAAPTSPHAAPDMVNIEIDGMPLQAPKGSMIVQAADKAGIPIPRFCYHEKLPIAANCRMCLVDVEKMPKPAPACATPVMEGMKVFTQTKRALDSQRNVMEFLLINHPLDCPICDQGGECELQDVAMGYGRSVSRYTEGKRVVADEDIGPLVATDMTRCIHCTRCVRFISEIAGTNELGGMGRGDRTEIGTYIGKSIESELSGNLIDVCPVGALTNKPFRFRARAWELTAKESLGYHDSLGSNLFLHTRRGEVLRSVPRDNEAINESWLSDRDRYSHAGLLSDDRLQAAWVREGADWKSVSLEQAISRAASALKTVTGDELGVLVHPSTTVEEGALLARLASGLSTPHLDHRLDSLDLADSPVAEVFEMPLAEVESAGAILLLGCNPRLEAPLLGHRVRKAWKRGCKVSAINPVDFDFNFELTQRFIVKPSAMLDAAIAVALAAGVEVSQWPSGLRQRAEAVVVDERAKAIAVQLQAASTKLIQLGESVRMHSHGSWLRRLARDIAAATGACVNLLSQGANSLGLARAGVLPSGLNASRMLADPRKAYVLYGIEPELDIADSTSALRALQQAGIVIAFSGYLSETLKRAAHIVLPLAMLPEMDGSLVNAQGELQQARAAAKAPGDARPGWRLLRSLGEQLNLAGFEATNIDELRAGIQLGSPISGADLAAEETKGAGFERISTWPIYRVDAVVRRAAPLAAHPLAKSPWAVVNPADALVMGLSQGSAVRVGDANGTATLAVDISTRVPQGSVWIERGHAATAPLSPSGALSIEKV